MDAVPDNPPPLPLGQVLAAERERLGMSRVDAAQRLHMSAWQVEALEQGDYSRLPRGTFLRGFVRNYARMLEVDVEGALDALARSAPATPAHRIVVPSQNIRFDPLGERLASPYVKAWGLAGVALALAFAGLYWWVFIRPAPPAVVAAARKEAIAEPRPQNIAAAPVAAPEPVAPAREAPRFEEPPASAPSVPDPAAATVPARPAEAAPQRPSKPPDVIPASVSTPVRNAAAEARTLRLRFKGHSWVEIKDRSGKVLLSKLNEAGSEAEVSGKPPFSVVVGNAPDVTMLYDERVFPLEPHTRVAVARFTLE